MAANLLSSLVMTVDLRDEVSEGMPQVALKFGPVNVLTFGINTESWSLMRSTFVHSMAVP